MELGKLLLALLIVPTLIVPAKVGATTVSVTNIITITARVAPARSIVVDDQGRMTKIYSNTAEAVEPRVYLHDVPGESRPLTPALRQQYDQILSQQKQLVGVEIPVALPLANDDALSELLLSSAKTSDLAR